MRYTIMSTISKLDYLKKYMDDGGTKKRKNKVQRKHKKNIVILDGDIGLNDIHNNIEEDENFALKEEIPLIFASDGATVLTKEVQEEIDKKKARWAPLQSNFYDKTDDKKSNDVQCVQRESRTTVGEEIVQSSKKRRHDSDDENSANENHRHDSSDSDMSPVRKSREDEEIDDKKGERSKRIDDDDDLSPLRQKKCNNLKKHFGSEPKIISTGRLGKVYGEIQAGSKQEMMKESLSSSSGKGSETIYRDRKTGKKIDVKFEELRKKRMEEEKLEQIEKQASWGKGITQIKAQEQKITDDFHEMNKPLARYKDDEDLDLLLKQKSREGDPMVAYLSKKQNKKSTKPRYNGPNPPINRFNIWPGYRYDGVDRSNGFEKKRFLAVNKVKSFSEEVYKWSVEDM